MISKKKTSIGMSSWLLCGQVMTMKLNFLHFENEFPLDDFPLEDLNEFFFTLRCLLDMEDDEIVVLFNQQHAF